MADKIPDELTAKIQALGKRSPPSDIQQVIERLCLIQPFSADELAHILQQNKKWVKRSYLSSMVRDGILEYTIPDNPKHPSQAYRARNRTG